MTQPEQRAGWYPQQDEHILRWWDGERWTDNYHPASRPDASSGLRPSVNIGIGIVGILVGIAGFAIAVSLPHSASELGLRSGAIIKPESYAFLLVSGIATFEFGLLSVIIAGNTRRMALPVLTGILAPVTFFGGIIIIAVYERGRSNVEHRSIEREGY